MCTWHTQTKDKLPPPTLSLPHLPSSAIAREQGPSKRCTCAIHLAAESLSRWVISSNKCCASRTASASTATSSTTVFPNIHYWRSPLPVIRRKSTEQHHTILPGHRTGDILAPHPPDGLHHGGHRHGRPTVRSAHPDMNGGRTGGVDTGEDDGGAELGPPFP
ncbi:hypothetical protein CIRG_01188 [Coccidioides immitis RMSCC 2394]|uniref:Uncharacterized protein n=1 Tax=Coccidioides immitis RMSCC 2394 TaxID=404692 RepID=A0A0J6Y358_COCIT|nr:hypothetical protein CIRG_01188 [Coccidioides immitis RMSCC 2394]